MATGIQGSLFADAPALGSDSGLRSLTAGLTRRSYPGGAWVEVRPGWITGADALFGDLRGSVPWRAERRRMYDRVVDVPRLVAHYQHDERLPHRSSAAIGALSARYRDELGGISPPPALPFTATARIPLPGMVIGSARAPRTTRWWPSCRSVRPGTCCCVLPVAARRSSSPSPRATCW